MHLLRIIFVIFAMVYCGLSQASDNPLTAIRVSHQAQDTRIVLSFTNSIEYQAFALHNPERIVVDIKQAILNTKVNAMDLSQTPVAGIRVGSGGPHVLRLVLDLKQAASFHTFRLVAEQNVAHRLVVDIKPTTTAETISKGTSAPTPAAPKTPVITASSNEKARNLIVVIDPGHGGKDPGASGPRGIHEKNIVLTIAKDLQSDLQQVPGIKVYMTRDSDYFIPLRGRLDIARKYKADLFVALHADAFRNSRAHGCSIFALSQRGATSESAHWLAEQENKSEMLGGSINLNDKDHLLKSVLLDMSQTATINSSLQLGNDILGRFHQFTHLHKDTVEQAAFVVLKSPDIPSILVENGFISNPYEERNLSSSFYQQRLAAAIQLGIIAYFKKQMPHNTIFSNHYSTNHYVVQKGDTLHSIASQFHVSVNELGTLNDVSVNSDLTVGRVLNIPK